MQNLKDILINYEVMYLRNLENYCNIYKKIGSTISESPAWFVFDCVDGNKLKFKNSQKWDIFFTIDIINEVDAEWFYGCEPSEIQSFFRELKYSYLHSQHPTIETPMRPNRH